MHIPSKMYLSQITKYICLIYHKSFVSNWLRYLCKLQNIFMICDSRRMMMINNQDRRRVYLVHTEAGGRRVLLAGDHRQANWVLYHYHSHNFYSHYHNYYSQYSINKTFVCGDRYHLRRHHHQIIIIREDIMFFSGIAQISSTPGGPSNLSILFSDVKNFILCLLSA